MTKVLVGLALAVAVGVVVVARLVPSSEAGGAAAASEESRVDIAWAGLQCLPGQNVQGFMVDGAEFAYKSPAEAARAEASDYGKGLLPLFGAAQVTISKEATPSADAEAEVQIQENGATVASFETRESEAGWVVDSWHQCVGTPRVP
jgi:hypothetical protein